MGRTAPDGADVVLAADEYPDVEAAEEQKRTQATEDAQRTLGKRSL